MLATLTPAQMRAADARAVARVGDVALMRNAGTRIAEVARLYAAGKRIAAFCGPGNNGGDAFVALARLADEFECVAYADESERRSPARADAEALAAATGVRIAAWPTTASEVHAALQGCALALDGLFGTGSRLPLPARVVPVVEALDRNSVRVLAIDIPSGIDAHTGVVSGTAVRASVTVALAALKPGLLLEPARDYVGDLWGARIGVPDADLQGAQSGYGVLDDRAFLDLLPQRGPESDKRSAGAPLIIAGSQQFPGAAVLCARGAARAGAGYVTVASAAAALRQHLVEQVVVTYDESGDPQHVIDELLDTAKRNSAIGIGPGLGLDERTGEIVRGVVAGTELPLVADASALFHFAKHLDMLRGKRIVVTPHESEFARLSAGGTVKPGQRVERLRRFVERSGITTLLKGRTTLIDDGKTLHLNPTGTNALATAGTGDVLTGMIATLLSQGCTPVDAARAGAYWHGLAGKYCARGRSVGVMAGDLPDALAAALPQRRAESDLVRVF